MAACCAECEAREIGKMSNSNVTGSSPQAVSDALAILLANRETTKSVLEDLNVATTLKARGGTMETRTSHRGGENVEDHWSEGANGRITREEIKVGPTGEASGAGAERMNREYSNNATQHGIQMDAEMLGRMFNPMAEAMKSIAVVLEKQGASLDVLSAAVMASAKSAERNSNSPAAAKSLFEEAKALVAKSDTMTADAAVLTGAARARAIKAAGDIHNEAAEMVVKANALLVTFPDAELAKAVADFAKSAEIALTKADDEQEEKVEDKMEDMKKSAITALEKAIAAETDPTVKASLTEALEKAKGSDAKGNQADRKDPATGNQDDAAVKAQMSAVQETVTKASEGMVMLNASLNQVMEILGKQSKLQGPVLVTKAVQTPLAIAKAQIIDFTAEVERAETNGSMNRVEAAEAREIIRYASLAADGKYDAAAVKARLAKAASPIKAVIGQLAA